MNNLKNKIEAILFVSGNLIKIADIANGLGVEDAEIKKEIAVLSDEYDSRMAGVRIIWIKDSVQMSSREDYSEDIDMVLAPLKITNLTKSTIETLSIIVYKQPITRTEVAEIRGVRSDYSINLLKERGLIKEAGKKDTLGNPTLFITTDLFLRDFNINSLDNLPAIEDISTADGTETNNFEN